MKHHLTSPATHTPIESVDSHPLAILNVLVTNIAHQSTNIYHNLPAVLPTTGSLERMISLMGFKERAPWNAQRAEAKQAKKRRRSPLMMLPLALAAGVAMAFFVIRRRFFR